MRRSRTTFAMAVMLSMGTVVGTVTGTALIGAGTAQAAPAVTAPRAQAPVADPTEKAAAEVRPAIVRIVSPFSGYVVDENGTTLHGGKPFEGTWMCTGFGVNPNGVVATAGHCVDGRTLDGLGGLLVQSAAQEVIAANPALVPADVMATAMAKWTVRGATPGSPIDLKPSVVTGSTEAGDHPQSHPAQVIDYRPFAQGDVALIKIDVADLPTVHLAPASDVRIGTPLLAIGFPASADENTDPTLEPSNKDGRISSKKTVGGVPFYEVSAAVAHGMSGGPTVDLDGNVLGVNSWAPDTQAINFIAPSSLLAELMTKNGVPNQAGPNDLLFRSALDAFYSGHYSDAIASLDKLLVAAPGHPQAMQLRADAFDAREHYGDAVEPAAPGALPFGLSPLLFWSIVGAGCGLVLIIVALVVVLIRRRRRRRAVTGSFPLPSPAPSPAIPTPSWPGAVPAPRTPWDGPQGAPFGSRTAVLAPPVAVCPRCATTLHDASAAFCHTCGLPRQS